MSEKLSKYMASFDYFHKTLIVLSVTTGGISTIYFTNVIGVPVEITRVSFSLVFYLTTGIIKKLLKVITNEIKKHNNIVMQARTKLNIIETLISQEVKDLEISHDQFKNSKSRKNGRKYNKNKN